MPVVPGSPQPDSNAMPEVKAEPVRSPAVQEPARSPAIEAPPTFEEDIVNNVTPISRDPASAPNKYAAILDGPEGSKYGAILDGEKGRKETAVKASIYAGSNVDPERRVKAMQLSRDTNIPVEIVERNFDEVKKKSTLSKTDYGALIDQTPALAKWVSDPKNSAIAHDDLDNLSYVERQIGNIKQQYTSGKRTTEMADIGMAAMLGNITPEQRTRLAAIEAETGADKNYNLPGFFEGIPGAVANQIPIFGSTLKKGGAGAGIGFAGGAAVGATGALIAGQLGPQVAIPEEIVTVPAAALASGLTGAYTGYRVGSAIGAGQMEASLAYLDLEKVKDEQGAPLDRSTMLAASGAVGIINGALESVGLHSVMKAAPGLRSFQRGAIKQALVNPTTRAAFVTFAKAIGESTATEGLTEGMQSIVTNLSQTFAKAYQDKSLPNWDTAKVLEVLTQAVQEGRAGAQGGGGMTLVTGGASLAVDIREVKKAEQAKESYIQMGEGLAKTKLHARDSESLGKLVDGITEDSETKNIYIPVEAMTEYFQKKGIPIEQVISELGADQAYQEAKGTGGDIKIPLAKWAEKVVGTEHWKGLENDVKFSPEELSMREVDTIRTETEGRAKAMDAEVVNAEVQAEEAKAKEAQNASAAAIFADVQQQLKDAGLSDQEAKLNPKLFEQFFSTLGEATGQDPLTLFKDNPLEIRSAENQNALPAAGDQVAQNQYNQDQVQAPPFYARSIKTVEEKMGGSASVEQINGMLKEIKPEERKWMGLDEFMKGKSKVSKEELLSHLRGSQVEIKEVVKDNGNNPFEAGGTKFSQYTLPGGENYREVLFALPPKGGLTLPDGYAVKENPSKKAAEKNGTQWIVEGPSSVNGIDNRYASGKTQEAAIAKFFETHGKAGTYKSSHFSEPNVLAHTRLNDRVDADGKKVLFVEEIQSDWHQEGRKKGYKDTEIASKIQSLDARIASIESDAGKLTEGGKKDAPQKVIEEWTILKHERDRLINENNKSVPDAPFRKTWHEFVLKRLIREAAEKGYDKIAWTTGEQQADRYDLAKQVDEVQAGKNEDGTFNIFVIKDGSQIETKENVPSDSLESQLGKDLAAKIIAEKGKETEPGGLLSYSGVDLKVGGEGMKGFYDKILPEFANKFGKKYGAKVQDDFVGAEPKGSYYAGINSDGKQAVFFSDPSQTGSLPQEISTHRTKAIAREEADLLNAVKGKENQQKVHSLTITPELKAAALNEGFSLFQGEGDGPKGRILINGREFKIDLFKSKDRSTFLHETGHYFLEVLKNTATKEGAPDNLKKDWAKIREWLGAKEGEQLTTEMHEKWARGFEQYLSEGKAPSLALRESFSKFRRWLTALWRRVSFDRVDMSPEVKELFDRMLATEKEISEAKAAVKMEEEFKLEGLDPISAEELKTLQEQARNQAEETLLKEKMGETTDEHKKKLAKDRMRLKIEAEKVVSEEPLFRSIDGIKRSLNKDPYKLADAALRGELKIQQAAQFELIADENGFVTAEDMATQIAEAGATNLFNSKVEMMVLEGLQANGMIKNAAQIREEALRAIHSEQMSELLALERDALVELATKKEITKEARARNRVIAREESRAAATEAARLLAMKPAAEAARPQVYITMERNAASRASRFMARKDYEKAAIAKKEQLIAHAMVRESFRINEEVESHFKYIQQFTNRGRDLLEMPYAFVRQVDALLFKYGFQEQKIEDLKTLQAVASKMEQDGSDANDITNATGLIPGDRGWVQESLFEFIDRQNENYHAMILPETLMSISVTDPQTMNIEELRDLRETVQMLVQGGKKHNRFLSEFIKVDTKQAALDIRTSIEKKVGKPREGDRSITAGQATGIEAIVESINNVPDAFIPSQVQIKTLSTFLDRRDKNGPVTNFIYRLMSRSEDKKQSLTEKSVEDVKKIFLKHYTQEELASYKTDKKIALRGFAKPLSREQVLSIALNWGNHTNRQRVLMGYDLQEADVQDALNQLDKKDWEFAQDVWNYFDTYWPEIARLEMAVKGVEPVKVSSAKVITKFGVYEGGYYPIQYDAMKSAEAHKMNEERSELYKQYSAVSAHTARGHAEARVARVKRPVRLSIDVIHSHLENVIHDISYRESVIDVNRLLREQDVKVSIQNALGVKGYRTFERWLNDIASDQRQSLEVGEQTMRWFRMKATMSSLGFRLITVPMDLTGNVITAVQEIGPMRMRQAIADHIFSKGDSNHDVLEKSSYMRQREKVIDRDQADLNRAWSKKKPFVDKKLSAMFGKDIALSNFVFAFQRFSDAAIAMPLWKEVYRHNLGRVDEETAIQIANETVKSTLGSGSSIDLVGAQRGGEFQKVMTMYYSWASMMFNRAWLEGKIAGLEYSEGNVLPAITTAAKATFYLWFAHAINENFWREFMRNAPEDDDDEDRNKRMLSRLLRQPFGYIWIGRDISGFAIDKAMNSRTSLRLTPLEQALETALTPIEGLGFAFTDPEKLNRAYLERSAKSAAMLTGTPQTLNSMAFNFMDWVNDKGEATWKDALSRRQKK